MFKYETHLHTAPASLCARADVRENLEFYKSKGYDGVFITNHFLDGNIGGDRTRPYEEQLAFYLADYEEALSLAKEIGIRVFFGVELTYAGTDFLVYGLDKAWFAAHPEIMQMKKSDELPFLMEEGALVIQAHPFREDAWIDHIRLYPRCVHGVEIINAARSDFDNQMAMHYAESYGLLPFAGSDNHRAGKNPDVRLAGMQSETPIKDELDFIKRVKNREMSVFLDLPSPKND